jgi:hypothetical protein
MTLQQAIVRNRIRQARFKRAERTLRRIRQRIFDYEDAGPTMYQKAVKVMATCQRILAPLWDQQRRNAQADRLHQNPSLYEPGGGGR